MRPPTVRKHYKLSVAPGQGASKYEGDLHKPKISNGIKSDLEILTEKSIYDKSYRRLSKKPLKNSIHISIKVPT